MILMVKCFPIMVIMDHGLLHLDKLHTLFLLGVSGKKRSNGTTSSTVFIIKV